MPLPNRVNLFFRPVEWRFRRQLRLSLQNDAPHSVMLKDWLMTPQSLHDGQEHNDLCSRLSPKEHIRAVPWKSKASNRSGDDRRNRLNRVSCLKTDSLTRPVRLSYVSGAASDIPILDVRR